MEGFNKLHVVALVALVLLLVTTASATHNGTHNAQNNYTYQTENYNSYYQENTYVFYNFGPNCGPSGCQRVCSTPNCGGQDSTAPVQSSNTNLEITAISHPSRLTAGEQATFQVTVANQGEQHANNVQLNIRAYGQLKQVDNLQIQSGRQKTFAVNITIPQSASGPGNVEVEAVAYNAQGQQIERDLETFRMEIRDLHMTVKVDPAQTVVGQPVTVYGMMSSAQAQARLYVSGAYEATIRPDQVKHYSHTIVPQDAGFHKVVLESGNTRATTFLRVHPKLGITSVNVPETANTQDTFQACATVFRSTQGQVTLQALVDGNEQAAETLLVNGEQRKCFDLTIQQEGTHTVTFKATSDGVTKTASRDVQVVESRVEVNVFPEQLTLSRGHSGVFQVVIKNQDARARTYQIETTGLDRIAEATDRTVTVGSGQSRTAYIRVSPSELGSHQGQITVTSNGFTFANTSVEVLSVNNPQLKNGGLLGGVGEGVDRLVESLRDRQTTLGVLLGVILLAAAGYVLYRRTQRSDVIEPRY